MQGPPWSQLERRLKKTFLMESHGSPFVIHAVYFFLLNISTSEIWSSLLH